MRPWISRHLGVLVVGGIVLIVAMTTSATAALVITGKDIKNSSVTTKDIKDGTLKTADLSKKTAASLKGSPFVGSACQVPGGAAGKVAMTVQPTGVITLFCKTAPVSGADVDSDADGFLRSQECNDTTTTMNPTVTEIFGNRIDDNCDGVTDDGLDTTDTDGDGSSPAGLDCDDTPLGAAINPGAADTLGDGRDNNCDGVDGPA